MPSGHLRSAHIEEINMSESELLQLDLEYLSLNYEILFWWAGTTFGLYSVAYLIGNKLRLGTVSLLIFTYALFTFFIVFQSVTILGFSQSVAEDLKALQGSGIEISNTSRNVISAINNSDGSLWIVILNFASLLLIAFGAPVYLIHKFREGLNARK